MSDKAPVEFSDIQGIARFGYGHLPEACFYLIQVENSAAARAWLRSLEVTTAERLSERPKTALQIAFTADGLRALGMADGIVGRFSHEFFTGIAGEESRSRRLGDDGLSAPQKWQWGGPGNMPHAVVMLYAQTAGLADWKSQVESRFPAGLRVIKRLDDSVSDGYEPFGFVDGISQPEPDWQRERKADSRDRIDYENTIALGEFLLGYPNEYGQYTDRPLLDAPEDPWAELARAEDEPAKRDLGRNGAYLIFRQLHQNAHGFWAHLNRAAGGHKAERQKIAEAMVGRSLEGKPLMPLSREPIAGGDTLSKHAALNQFTYDLDPFGERCPVGAHIRRANPRNADLAGKPRTILARLLRRLGFKNAHIGEDLVSATRFHRLLRRGRKYGTTLGPEEAIGSPNADAQERGIYFIALAANISRQFEFVQNAWIMGAKFAGFTAESDPLLGSRNPVPGCPASDGFSMPQANGINRRITGLPQFVTVRGGAYFFLPSIRALKYLSRLEA